jgi:hypothetical protein
VLTQVDPIEAKLERLEAKAPLRLDDVDFSLRDRHAVRARLAAPLAYSQRVEAMVTGLSIETLLPRAATETGYINRFLTIWQPDEQGHARALERLLMELDMEPFPLPEDEPVPLHNRLAGLLGGASTRVHETVELIYHTIGAMNERLAFSAYERMSEVLLEIGELGLVHTLMRPLRRDESAHLGYYRTAARELRDRLDRWQLFVARNVVTRTYAPVGAGAARDRPAFGATIRALGQSEDLVSRVQVLAESLLSVDDRRLRPFVQASFARCTTADQRSASDQGAPVVARLAASRRSSTANPNTAIATPYAAPPTP